MGVTVTADEADRRLEGARKERQEVIRRHGQNRTDAREELAAVDHRINRTRIVNPDPEKAYRLVNRNKDGERISLLEGSGYEVVPDDDKTQLAMSSKRDGAQIQGDLVLMRTTASNYEQRRASKRRYLEQIYGNTIEETKERINKIARDGGVIGPHEEASVDRSGEY